MAHQNMNSGGSRSPDQVALLLKELRSGKRDAVERLMPLVYDELHLLAVRYMQSERISHTLQPTALVNEAYLRLVGQRSFNFHDRSHFISVASQAMRRVLVDHARKVLSTKRGGEAATRPLQDEEPLLDRKQSEEMVDLNAALEKLHEIDPRQSQIVEMRFFGGLTIEETAEALGTSPRTVKRDWTVARAWLHGEIRRTSTSRE